LSGVKCTFNLNDRMTETTQRLNIISVLLHQDTLRYAPAYAEATQCDKLLFSINYLLTSYYLLLTTYCFLHSVFCIPFSFFLLLNSDICSLNPKLH